MRSPSSSKLPFFVFFLFSSSLLFWGAPLPLSVATDHADLNAGNVVTLTQDNFREHVEDGNTWLVDFYAPWYSTLVPVLKRFLVYVCGPSFLCLATLWIS
jgi:hypothetical protein